MPAKARSPIRSKSPNKSNAERVNARARHHSEESKKGRKQHKEPKTEETSKTAAIFMGLFFLMFISSAVYSFFKSKSSEEEKPRRQQIAGLDIPREVIERMQKLRGAEDRERILMEWAESEGITFEDRRDGSYVALRDGEEYILREADPDFNPDVENQTPEEQEVPEEMPDEYDDEIPEDIIYEE